jgi:hypothetical protein
MMKMNTAHARERQGTRVLPEWPFGTGGAHMYDENQHRTRTGAPGYFGVFPKWPFGLGAAHLYDHVCCVHHVFTMFDHVFGVCLPCLLTMFDHVFLRCLTMCFCYKNSQYKNIGIFTMSISPIKTNGF